MESWTDQTLTLRRGDAFDLFDQTREPLAGPVHLVTEPPDHARAAFVAHKLAMAARVHVHGYVVVAIPQRLAPVYRDEMLLAGFFDIHTLLRFDPATDAWGLVVVYARPPRKEDNEGTWMVDFLWGPTTTVMPGMRGEKLWTSVLGGIENLSDGTVVDPFARTGDVLAAVKTLNESDRGYKLKGLGFERDETLWKKAKVRLAQLSLPFGPCGASLPPSGAVLGPDAARTEPAPAPTTVLPEATPTATEPVEELSMTSLAEAGVAGWS